MRRKDGDVRSDYDRQLDELIIDVITEKKLISIDRIKNILNKRYSRKLGWVTIKRHIDNLLDNGRILLNYESKEGEKTIRLYKIDNS